MIGGTLALLLVCGSASHGCILGAPGRRSVAVDECGVCCKQLVVVWTLLDNCAEVVVVVGDVERGAASGVGRILQPHTRHMFRMEEAAAVAARVRDCCKHVSHASGAQERALQWC